MICDKNSKAVIVGAGRVGASTALAMALRSVVSEIVLVDIDKPRADAEALDIAHGLSYTTNVICRGGSYEDCIGADFIIITAGASQQPGDTRLDLLQRNQKILKSILTQTTKYNKDAIYLLVANPVDILTYMTIKEAGLSKHQVFGTGTSLDTARFKYLMAQHFNINTNNIHGYIMGEHGNSQFAAISHASVGGIPLMEHSKYDANVVAKIAEDTKNAAYQIIEGKGSTHFGIGMVTAELVEAMVMNQQRVYPVSALLEGEFGLEGVSIGVPAIIDSCGMREVIEIEISEEEKEKLHKSAEVLKGYIKDLGY